jgi:hypothetical protein
MGLFTDIIYPWVKLINDVKEDGTGFSQLLQEIRNSGPQ